MLFVQQREARLADAAGARAADARTLTARLAAAIPRELERLEILERVPEAARFCIEAGRPCVPATVGWLDEPPRHDPTAELDVLVAEALRRALVADGSERIAALDAFAARDDVPRTAADHARLAAAWTRWRQQGAGVDLTVELAPDASPEQRASAALLELHVDPEPDHDQRPEGMPPWLGLLPEPRARAWLTAAAATGGDVAGWHDALDHVVAKRHRLAIARDALAKDSSRGVRRHGSHVVVLHADRGAVLTADEAANLATSVLAESLLGAEVATGAPEGAIHADAVDGLLHVVAPVELDPGALDAGGGTLAIAIVLLAALVAGVGLAWHGVSREARAARVQTEFLTMVTHELKTPLAGIRLATELLSEGYVDDPDERHA